MSEKNNGQQQTRNAARDRASVRRSQESARYYSSDDAYYEQRRETHRRYREAQANQQPASYEQPAKKGAYVPARTSYVGTSSGSTGFSRYSRNSGNYTSSKYSMSTGAKIGMFLLIAAIIAGLVFGGLFIMKELRKREINEDLHGGRTAAEMQAIDEQLTGSITYEEPFTMLLLGSDARSDDPEMGARTDTIILVRVDTANNTVSMLSIPRDTMIYIDGYGTQKFNAAYTFGGPAGTIAAVKDLTGIDIDHYAEINFEGMVDLIDAIGGIDVEVDEEIYDPDAGDYYIPEGYQHLNGEEALTFARSRAYADGDYTRVSNQRKVIMALLYKMLETPASELTDLIKTSTSFVSTDSAMDFDFIYAVADQMRHNDLPITIYSATLPSYPDMVDGISYVIANDEGVRMLSEDFVEGKDISSGDYPGAIVYYTDDDDEEEYYEEEYYEEEYYEEEYYDDEESYDDDDSGGEEDG